MSNIDWKCDVCHNINEWNDVKCPMCMRSKKISLKFIRPVAAEPHPIPLYTADWKNPDAESKHNMPASMRLRKRDPDTQTDMSALLRGEDPAVIASQIREEPYTGLNIKSKNKSQVSTAETAASATTNAAGEAQAQSKERDSLVDDVFNQLVPDEESRAIQAEVEVLSLPWSRKLTSVAEAAFSQAKPINPLDIDWDNCAGVSVMKTVLAKLASKLHNLDPQGTVAVLGAVPGLQEALAPPPMLVPPTTSLPIAPSIPPSNIPSEAVPGPASAASGLPFPAPSTAAASSDLASLSPGRTADAYEAADADFPMQRTASIESSDAGLFASPQGPSMTTFEEQGVPSSAIEEEHEAYDADLRDAQDYPDEVIDEADGGADAEDMGIEDDAGGDTGGMDLEDAAPAAHDDAAGHEIQHQEEGEDL